MGRTNISEMLQSLIDVYGFNINTLSKYLGVSIERIAAIKQDNLDCLPEENTIRCKMFDKIAFLYFGAMEDTDMKLSAFLEVLISYHNLSKSTIAKMAGVEVNDIDRVLANPPKKVNVEAKYKIAITVMGLRFFLKDCEPSI